MKNNSFRFLHLFLVTASLGLILVSFGPEEKASVRRGPTSLPRPSKNVDSFPIIKRINQRQRPTEPMKGPSRGPASTRPYHKFEIARAVRKNPQFRMSAGNVLAENISAVPLSTWKPGMPKLIFDDGVYGYYQTTGNAPAIPVAYNQRLKKFSPISSIVHVKGVDEATREKLIKAGFKEYYYFKNIQRLSLQSSPNQVVQLYKELEKQGLNVKLEVIHDKPVSH